MAASLSRLSAGLAASRPLGLSRSFLLLVLLLLNSGYKGDSTKPAQCLRAGRCSSLTLSFPFFEMEASPRVYSLVQVPLGAFLVLVILSLLCVATVSPWHTVPEACGQPWWPKNLDLSRHWPWEVSLRVGNEHVCGGALIDLKWVVTAAHCIQGTKEYSVILGTSKLKPPNSTRTLLIPVRDIIMHPKYWGRTFIMGDVALLQLYNPVIISKYVQPICLPEPNYSLKVGTQCWVTGWGQVKQRFSANSTLAPELQEAEVFIMDNKKCDQIYRKKSHIPRVVPLVLGDMICATNYREDLCSGDSGGPLACEVEGRWILAGVLSWEKACAKVRNPGVYTRITKYSRWIKKQISNGILSVPCTSAWLLLLFWLLQPQMGP